MLADGQKNVFMDLAKTLKIDSVSRLHTSPPLRISPTQTVAEAAGLMRQEGVGCLLVCEGDRMVGIFTERDLMRRVLAAGKPLTLTVAECMTANPVVVHRKEPIGAAVRRMEEGGYRHLPVVDEVGRVVAAEVVFQFRVTPKLMLDGLLFAAVMGTIGGFLPARLAARTLIIRALRTEV